MAIIVIKNLSEKVIPVGDFSKTLLKHFQDNFQDWMHACGGKGRCTTCRAVVLKGIENFGELSQPEIRYRERGLLADNERLMCQSTIMGDVELRVPDDCKLPHLDYSE